LRQRGVSVGCVDARRGPEPREADPRAKTLPQRPLEPSDREDGVPGPVDRIGGTTTGFDRPGPVGLLQRRGGPALHDRCARRRVVVRWRGDRQLQEARPQKLDRPHREHLGHARGIGRSGVHPAHDRLARHPIDDPQLGAPGLGAGHHGHQGGGRPFRDGRQLFQRGAHVCPQHLLDDLGVEAGCDQLAAQPHQRFGDRRRRGGRANQDHLRRWLRCGRCRRARLAGQQSGERDHWSERAAAARDHRA